jgi:hypothetical protein
VICRSLRLLCDVRDRNDHDVHIDWLVAATEGSLHIFPLFELGWPSVHRVDWIQNDWCETWYRGNRVSSFDSATRDPTRHCRLLVIPLTYTWFKANLRPSKSIWSRRSPNKWGAMGQNKSARQDCVCWYQATGGRVVLRGSSFSMVVPIKPCSWPPRRNASLNSTAVIHDRSRTKTLHPGYPLRRNNQV